MSSVSYKWLGWVEMDWKSPGGVKYRAAYAAKLSLNKRVEVGMRVKRGMRGKRRNEIVTGVIRA